LHITQCTKNVSDWKARGGDDIKHL
jgi:hypothetical protein